MNIQKFSERFGLETITEPVQRGPKPKSNSQINIIRNLLNTGNYFSEMELTKATVPNVEERYEPGHRAARGYIHKLREEGMEIITREIINPYTNNPTIEYGVAKNEAEYYLWKLEQFKDIPFNNIPIKKGRRKIKNN